MTKFNGFAVNQVNDDLYYVLAMEKSAKRLNAITCEYDEVKATHEHLERNATLLVKRAKTLKAQARSLRIVT